MSFLAETELTVAGPIEAVFSHFVDYREWSSFMPSTFRPLRGPARPLRTGDRLLVLVTGAPAMLTVNRVEAPREVIWSGGLPGVLHARHSFTFESLGPTSTLIRSSEPWTGVVTALAPVAARVKKAAESVGRSQLRSFERWFQASFAPA